MSILGCGGGMNSLRLMKLLSSSYSYAYSRVLIAITHSLLIDAGLTSRAWADCWMVLRL